VNQQLTAQTTRHSLFVQRFAGHLANLFDPYVERLKADIKSVLIDAPQTTSNLRKINALLSKIKQANLITFSSYNEDVLFKELLDFAASESAWEAESIKSVIKSSVAISIPPSSQIWSAVLAKPLVFADANKVKLLKDFIKDWQLSEINRVSDIIRTGYIVGNTTDEIVRDIAGKGAVIDKAVRRNIKSMVRTSVNFISNAARLELLENNIDIISGYRLAVVFDSRTTPICRAYGEADTLYLLGENNPVPPFHVACRTTIIPEVIGESLSDRSKTTKASKGDEGGAQIPANETYYSWLKKQSAEFQDDAIGKTRGLLLRNGGLTSKQFGALTVDQQFRPLTLVEMEARNPLAFKNAGIG